ncbi:hypothetical protein Riv7116_1708 [Rivularia sp. PCC 7116]|uniref:eCIS core domain-containing protein n=1 Tax=Rivularia sp. PCC 7116 TaxID=373994 RepID=UPI00029EF597|nr:DUF4157 domain-containing protein [Rivularia sp. PCC 7116]AFY54255.1 hypothetical protein Riv7116_1708 [Rivularia sp. PCC 7116]
MYRQEISQKTSPPINSHSESKDINPSRNYGSLSSVVQRAQQDVNSINADEKQQLESAIGTKATGEVLTGKQWVPEFKGISGQLWGDAAIQMKGKDNNVSEVELENKTGLPDNLKAGIENISGIAMDDVKVHYNSSEPSKFQALAYTQGTDIHVGRGQERHLPHEAWHVVQQKQGRVKPTLQMKGAAINNDSSLEREADVMGAKALQSSLPTTQLQKHYGSASVLQRQETSFPEDSEEKLKEMGVLQRKEQSGAIQFRGGPTVGILKIKSSDIGSSLLAGHAWLSYTPTGGGEVTHGTWGNTDHIGYNRNFECGRNARAERATDVDNTDLGNLNNFIAANDKWTYLNNCSSFAARGWRAVTKERLAYKSLGFIPNPSALGVGIVAANGGTTGVLPANRGSSANSASSTSSSSAGFSSNSVNSALGSGLVGSSVGSSVSKSSGSSSI